MNKNMAHVGFFDWDEHKNKKVRWIFARGGTKSVLSLGTKYYHYVTDMIILLSK